MKNSLPRQSPSSLFLSSDGFETSSKPVLSQFWRSPRFPLEIPCIQRAATCTQVLLVAPSKKVDRQRPKDPTRRIGRRPSLSENFPHWCTVAVCAKKRANSY